MTKVNHWGVEVNSESPITGVLNSSAPKRLYEDVERKGIDTAFEEHLKTCTNEDHSECYFIGNYEDEATYLVGFRKITGELDKGKYEPDPEAKYSAIVGPQYTQVLQSKYLSRAALCSPCFPGQGDLDTPGEFMTYQLPPDLWGEREHLEIIKIEAVVQ